MKVVIVSILSNNFYYLIDTEGKHKSVESVVDNNSIKKHLDSTRQNDLETSKHQDGNDTEYSETTLYNSIANESVSRNHLKINIFLR